MRASAFDKWGTRPGELKDLLAKRGLTFAVLSSGNLNYQPANRGAQIDLHLSHAKFVRDAGGVMLQVIDEKPKDRPVTADDLVSPDALSAFSVHGFGGSDAHLVSLIGICATEFDRDVRTTEDLVDALREGGYRAVDYRERLRTQRD